MAYSALVQEQYFRPHRLKVVRYTFSVDPKAYLYGIAVFNADELVKAYRPGNQGAMGTWETVSLTQFLYKDLRPSGFFRYESAKLAIDTAKALAVAESLAFNPQQDIVDFEDLRLGPPQKCVVCGSPAGRSKVPVLCAACKATLAAGRAAEGEKHDYWVDHNLSPDSKFDLNAVVYRMFGLTPGQTESLLNARRNREKVVVADAHMTRTYDYTGEVAECVRMTDQQARAIKELTEWVAALYAEAKRMGQVDGQSILRRLIDGQMTVEQFNDRTARKDGD